MSRRMVRRFTPICWASVRVLGRALARSDLWMVMIRASGGLAW